MRTLSIPFCLIVTASLLAGCGGGNAAVPYEGVVRLNGEPLGDATVTLLPTSAAHPGPYSGVTDSWGKFALGPAANPGGRGVIPGKYRLIISTLKIETAEGGDESVKAKVLAPERVPEEYRSGNMRIEVPAEGITSASFEIAGRH